jgi:hypothetical protein
VAITLTPKQFKSLFGAKALAAKPKRKSTVPSVAKKSGPERKYEQHLWELKLCGQVLEYKFQPRAFVLEQHEKMQPDGKTKRFKVTIRPTFGCGMPTIGPSTSRSKGRNEFRQNRARFARPTFPCRTRL